MAAHGIPWGAWKRPNAPPEGWGNDAIRIPRVQERSVVAHGIPWGPLKRPNAQLGRCHWDDKNMITKFPAGPRDDWGRSESVFVYAPTGVSLGCLLKPLYSLFCSK